MSAHFNCCVLAALHGADLALSRRIGDEEAQRAADRCAHRIERAIAAHGGQLLEATRERTLARFASADTAVQAAADALARIRNLPPPRGLKHPVRLGLHCGPVDTRGTEPAGEAVVQALHIAAGCEPEQALASATVFARLGADARPLATSTPLDRADTHTTETALHEIGRVATGPALPVPRLSGRLCLRHRQTVIYAEESRPVVLLGRELGNDLVVADPRASRQHARIERRNEGFVLFDSSTNGSFVRAEGQPDSAVRRNSLLLSGRGRIGCGFAPDEHEAETIFFDLD